MFKITRVYAGDDGHSRFEDIELPLKSAGEIGRLSEAVKAKEIIFREVPAGYDYDFHTAPQRQYIILLDGGVEIESSLGEKRRFETGEILLVEDTTGRGHKTRNLEAKTRKSVFIVTG